MIQASWADLVWVETLEYTEGQHIISSSCLNLDADWGCSLTASTYRQLCCCICFIAPWGTDIIYHNLLWVSISYSSTIDCIDEQLIAWGCFLSVNLYHVSFLPFSMAMMTEGLLSSIGLSGLLAGSTRTVPLGMPVTLFRTALADGILHKAVVIARGMWMGAVGALWSRLLWLVFPGLMALPEGMYGFTSTHHSCSGLNGIIHTTNFQDMWYFFSLLDLEESLLQLNVGIWDGLNEPALDLELNGSITTIAYLCMAGKLVYPVYKFINWFVRPLLDIFKLIHSDSGRDNII